MSRKDTHTITKRIIVTGNLVLQTPANLGNGDAEGVTDMPLLQTCDATGKSAALLTGSSIAGALRNYVRAYEQGFFNAEISTKKNNAEEEKPKKMDELLFGGIKSDDGMQSPLIVCDATSENSTIELRDGVKIDPNTRTPVHQGKYDLELLAAGTAFNLQFELAIAEKVTPEDEQQLRSALAIALHGLQNGEIAIGMKKRRGFGQCNVSEWQVWEFDMQKPTELLQWLAFERNFSRYTRPEPGRIPRDSSLPFIMEKLGLQARDIPDQRHTLTLNATFALCGSILIRSGQDEAVLGPDVRHLHAKQANGDDSKPVVSGTSLAGVVRHRAERIVNTISNSNGKGAAFINDLFGYVDEKKRKACASRIVVHEREIKDAETKLVQNRIAIDRFTGGAYDGALFNEQPAFAKPDTTIELSFEIFEPIDAQIGLLLLLLKDLWTSDLPLGGTSSVGRGRLRGISATLTERMNGTETMRVTIEQHGETLNIDSAKTVKQLNKYVTVLCDTLKEDKD